MAPTAAKRVCLVTTAIAKMVAFVVSTGTVGYFIDQWDKKIYITSDARDMFDIGLYGREEFFFFALATGFFVAILSMVIAIANLQDKVHWALPMGTLHAFCALTLFVSALLIAKTSMSYELHKTCKVIEKLTDNAKCDQLITGAAFGFGSMVLCIGDAIVYLYSLTQNAEISFVNMENIPS